jgi:hypothetical protein
MGKTTLLKDLEEALKILMCKELNGVTKEAMETAIARFFKDVVSKCSPQELMQHFQTPDRAVKFFLDYVDEEDFLKDPILK